MNLGGLVRRDTAAAAVRRAAVRLPPRRPARGRRGHQGFFRRHRAGIASYVALILAIGAVVTYAINAQGFRAHQTRLNDGGIWVTDNADAGYGRLNKPIGQLDGAITGGLRANLDIVQEDSAVVGVDLSGGTISSLDPAAMKAVPGAQVPIPAAPEVEERGGTLGVADTATGKVWGTRIDPIAGSPTLTSVGRESKPLFRVGPHAALAVSVSGTLYAVSAKQRQLLRAAPSGPRFAKPTKQRLSLPGSPRALDLTTVGETPVVLDPAAGRLQVVGGPAVTVPKGSVLQQPGPPTTSVLVGSPTSLLAVDLEQGSVSTVAKSVHGRPAEPVHLGDCDYGAWSGGTGYAATVCPGTDPMIAGLRTQTTDLVFRLNRGQIVLNDRATGAVWDVQRQQPERLDNWDAYRTRPTKTHHDQHDDNPSTGDNRPPKAKDDTFGARPGRATVLYPLDNDSAPAGRLLAIRDVRSVSDPAARARVSPDGQVVSFTLPPNARGTTTFEYFVDDGRDGVSAHATVRVQARPGGINAAPILRPGLKPRIWNVPASGSLTVPVISDWRDYRDGDALSLVSAVPESATDEGAAASVTTSGQVRFQAPSRPGLVRVRYAATDSLSAPVERRLVFRVQGQDSQVSFPAVAEPDVVVGEAGKPITIKPLLNDLPGSDPFDPHAALSLAGRVAQPTGAQVGTDLQKGTITLRSPAAHTYFLDYQAAYGNAKAARGRIRVDVRNPARSPQDPVAMPDQATLRGQTPALVDVLGNDFDPSGGLLEVQTASAADATQLDVGVVDGRWLRITSPQGALSPNPQVVGYQISDGEHSGINGQVVVNQRPDPPDDDPVTNDDDVTVRAGNAVAIPVLDNDYSPSGDQLDLVRSVAGQPPGRLEVTNEGKGPTGSAYVVGRQVRYVAPAKVSDGVNVEISYVAVNSSGRTTAGTANVNVVPASRDNNPPEPPELEGRTVSGDVVKLRLPGSGVDPDGDSVTIQGLDTAPSLGRVLKIGANSIDYQAYPGSVGTDTFTYQLADSEGATAIGTARVAVAPPTTPQPPLAVADRMTVAPGRTATIDVLANDLVSAGDRVTLSLVSPPAGVSLASPTGPLRIQTPATSDGHDEVVVYRISNGIDVSQAAVTLSLVQGYDNPPVVFDAFGSTGNGDTVTTDVLATAYDPDGPSSALKVIKVLPPRGVKAKIQGPKIQVSRGKDPTVVPFVVADGEGGTTTGNLYVPAATGARPYVKQGALIRIKPDGSYSGKLSSLVVNPTGRPLRFTAANRVWTSPQPGVDVAVTGQDSFRLDAARGYTGPGALAFEVTTAGGRNAQNKKHAVKAVLTVPVQVGEDKPVLQCPSNSLSVAQGESISVDVRALCHIWTIDPAQQSRLRYDASWQKSAKGLSLGSFSGSQVQVRAGSNAVPGSVAVLNVSASGSDEGQVQIRVTSAKPPRMTPIRVGDLRYGESRTLDLSRYLIPGVRDPQPAVLSARQVSGVPVRITSSGTSVTLRASRHVHGHATFRVVMSDAGRSAGPERRAQGLISLDILDVPGAPGRPLTDPRPHDSFAPISFSQAEANGSPVLGYQVRDDRGGVHTCGTTTCTISGLHNGKTYRFSVRARNAVGYGPWGGTSRNYTPYARAGQVRAVRMTDRGDHYISLAWDAPPAHGSAIRRYEITWKGAGRAVTSTTEHVTIPNLNNDNAYRFLIIPYNGFGAGIRYQSRAFRPIGTPLPPGKPDVQDIPQDGPTGQASITWAPVDPNGPPDVRYDVYRDETVVCAKIQATQCTDAGLPYDGHTYTYTIAATNQHGVGLTSGRSIGTSYQSVGTPSQWGGDWRVGPTGNDQEVQVDYNVPLSRGSQSIVNILVNGNVSQTFNEVGTVSHRIAVPSDDSAYNISLRVCNEYDRCTSTPGSQSVQAYGPLRGSNLTSLTANPNQNQISYTISGNTNGRPATLTITGDKGTNQSWNLPPGPFTVTSQPVTTGWSKAENVRVTMADPQINRGSASASTTGQSQPAPQPTVGVSKGASCNDGPDSQTPCSDQGGGPLGGCQDSTCAFVVITLNGFVDQNATCTFDVSGLPNLGSWEYFNGQHQLDGSDGQRRFYYGYPGGTIKVTCDNGVNPPASGEFTWG